MWSNGKFYGIYPLVFYGSSWKWQFRVSFPIQDWDFHSYLSLPLNHQRRAWCNLGWVPKRCLMSLLHNSNQNHWNPSESIHIYNSLFLSTSSWAHQTMTFLKKRLKQLKRLLVLLIAKQLRPFSSYKYVSPFIECIIPWKNRNNQL